MRRRLGWVCALVGMGVLLAGVGPASTAVPKKCAKGKIARVANGKKVCVAAKVYRQRVTRLTPGASALQRALTAGPAKLRKKNGRVVADVIRPKLVAAAVTAYTAAEAELTVAVRAAMGQTANARLHGTVDGPPVINRSPDGSVSGSISKTVAIGGQSLTMNVGLTGHPPGPAGGDGTIDIEVGAALDDGAGTTTGRSFRIKDINFKHRQTCPDATGAVQIDERFEGGTTGSTTFGSTRVKLGTVREAVTVAIKVTGRAQMGSDGTFRSVPLTVTVNSDYSRSAQVLAFLQARTRGVTSGTLTGSLNPATGLLTGATITTNVRTSGFAGTTTEADAKFRAMIEKMLNDETGRVLKSLKEIEANVRAGRCDDSYEVTLAIQTDATFATHDATGTLGATLIATATRTGAARATVFDGTATTGYQGVVFTSKIPPCTFANDPATQGTLTFHLTITPTGTLHVKWDGSAGLDAKATVQCPNAPPIAGEAGPSLISPSPMEFDLPIDGGQQTVAGGLTDAAGGWVHSGTITVTRRPPPT